MEFAINMYTGEELDELGYMADLTIGSTFI